MTKRFYRISMNLIVFNIEEKHVICVERYNDHKKCINEFDK